MENKWELLESSNEDREKIWTKNRTFAGDVWFRFRHKPTAIAGLILILVLLVFARWIANVRFMTYDTHSKSVRYQGSVVLLDKMGKNLYSLFYPCSRGDSGALYSQSATARVMPSRGRIAVKQPLISDVDTWVLRNRNP